MAIAAFNIGDSIADFTAEYLFEKVFV